MKKDNKALKFLEGAAAGFALGVAGSMFMASKAGKALKENAKDTLADFYKYVAPKVKKIGKMGKEEYHAFMKNSVERYSKAKKISKEVAEELAEEAQKSWDHLFRHLKK